MVDLTRLQFVEDYYCCGTNEGRYLVGKYMYSSSWWVIGGVGQADANRGQSVTRGSRRDVLFQEPLSFTLVR